MARILDEYTQKILGYVGSKPPLSILKTTPGKLSRAIRGVSLSRLSRRPAKGKWSVREILAHLAEDEMVWGYRIRKILETNGVEIQGFDQERWAENSRYETTDPRVSLEMVRAIRSANLQLLAGIPKSAWKRYGRHSEFGRLTLDTVARLLAGHDLNHLIQIRRILK